MTMPLATCPFCGNSKDGSIHIQAECVAVVEDDQYDYFDFHFNEEKAMTTCTECGHRAPFVRFKLHALPLRIEELEELLLFLQDIAKDYKGIDEEAKACRCLALLRQHAAMQTNAPADAGE